jgi:hypothetical protein
MICNRCGNQNDNTNKFCLRCGNQLLPNMYNKPKKNNTGLIVGIVVGCFIFMIIIIKVVLPILLFSADDSKLDTKYKVKKYLKEKYSNESFTVLIGPTVVETNDKSCGNYKEYTWIVKDNNTNEEFEITSSKAYKGAFVCSTYNSDTYSKGKNN